MNRYKEIRDNLNTFDIICCDHKDWLMRWIGHTAMIIRDYDKDIVYIWQSTTKYAGVKGTSLSLFSDWLRTYSGKVCVRRFEIEQKRRELSELLLENYIRKHRGDPYPDLKSAKGLWYMAKIVLDLPLPVFENNPNEHIKLACSGRVADTLQYCGLIYPMVNINEVEPDDFRVSRPLHTPIDNWLVKGVTLGAEERIK